MAHSFFHTNYPVIEIPLVKNTFLSLLNYINAFIKNQLTVYMLGLFLGFISLIYLSILTPI